MFGKLASIWEFCGETHAYQVCIGDPLNIMDSYNSYNKEYMSLLSRSVMAVDNWPAWVLPTAAECAAAAVRPFCSSMYPSYNKTLSGIPFNPIQDPKIYGEQVPDVLCRLPPADSTWPVVNPVTDPHTPVNKTNLFGVCTNSNPPSPAQAEQDGGGTYPDRWCGPARFSSDSSKASGYTYYFYADGASSSIASTNVRPRPGKAV